MYELKIVHWLWSIKDWYKFYEYNKDFYDVRKGELFEDHLISNLYKDSCCRAIPSCLTTVSAVNDLTSHLIWSLLRGK